MKRRINNYGRKIPYARKDYYLPKEGEYRINVSQIWPKSKIQSEDKFTRYLINILYEDLNNKKSLKTTSKEEADKYIQMICSIRDQLLDIKDSDEFFNVVRRIQYGTDFNNQPVYDLDLLFGEHGISYSKMNRAKMLEAHFEQTPEEIARNEVETKLWFLRFDWETKFNENLNLIEIEIPYEYDLITIHIPASISFCEQEWEGYFLVEWDEKKERRFVSMINASQGDYDLRAAEMYKKELEKLKPPKKHSSKIKIDQTANPGVYEGPDYLEGFFPKEEIFLKKFGLAGQFGNSFTQRERRKVMPKLYRSFSNLALALGCSPECLSLTIGRKNLGIALGARGHGGLRSAAAHYEPTFHVINITRKALKHGSSHLGHEFMHALDRWMYFILIGEDRTRLLSDLPVEQIAGVLPEMAEIVEIFESSRFRQDALSLDLLDSRDPQKPYWSTTREMFARAGNSVIEKKLLNISRSQKEGIRDDFLSFDGPKEVDYGLKTISPCPTGKELDQLTRLFENLFEALLKKGLWQPLKKEDLFLRTACQRISENPIIFGSQISFF